jgi:hypothetical protein
MWLVDAVFSIPPALLARAHLCKTLSPFNGSEPTFFLMIRFEALISLLFRDTTKFEALLYAEVKTALTKMGCGCLGPKNFLSFNCLMDD